MSDRNLNRCARCYWCKATTPLRRPVDAPITSARICWSQSSFRCALGRWPRQMSTWQAVLFGVKVRDIGGQCRSYQSMDDEAACLALIAEA